MPSSVLDAIRLGIWDYEPEKVDSTCFHSTRALPGSREKLDIMARRLATGLPLWHPEDRRTYDESAHADDF